jgi:hypothetical protein
MAPDAKIIDEISLDTLAAALPLAAVTTIVRNLGVASQRRRKLPAELALLVVVVMSLYPLEPLEQVLARLVQGVRFIAPDGHWVPATKGAICQARSRLGAAVMVALFHEVCRPMATAATPGAFLFGRRLMAIDGTTEDVPDTPEHRRVFGKPGSGRGEAAFPQVQAVYLVECGPHAIVDAGFWPCRVSERVGGLRLLRSVAEGMLLMWDRGFHSFDMAQQTRARGADFLGRVPAHVDLKPLQRLADGSYLAYLYPGEAPRKKRGEHLLVRVIDYTVTDPALPGYQERHRLITSLLDPAEASAPEVAVAYHERWEIEITIDEVDTHQRLANHPLRSQKPVGVIQELYGLLIAHYAIRRVMLDAAGHAGLDPDRISFVNAVRIVCMAIPEFQKVCPEQRDELYLRLLNDIARHRLPERKSRSNPRVVKRKMSKFPLKRAEHRRCRQPSMSFRDAVAILN